jgi:hypothetical protein
MTDAEFRLASAIEYFCAGVVTSAGDACVRKFPPTPPRSVSP